MSFSEKKITLRLYLSSGYVVNGVNEIVISNARVEVYGTLYAGYQQGNASVVVYGLSLDVYNALTNVGANFSRREFNRVEIEAGDSQGMSLIFAGNIIEAVVDGGSPPDIKFSMSVWGGAYYVSVPANDTSVRGKASVTELMSGLAKTMGLAFNNVNVDSFLIDPFFSGSAWEQVTKIAQAAQIEFSINRNVLTILKPNTAISEEVIVINRQTGLIGYPSFNQNRVNCDLFFNPRIEFQSKVKIESDFSAANGTFIVTSLSYQISTITNGGPWKMSITAIVDYSGKDTTA